MSNRLILIPARGGSTRVINKNLRLLAGKPLIAHVIESAMQSAAGRVVLSTDSSQIAETGRSYGAETPFMRPVEISTAKATSLSAILHALIWFKDNESWVPSEIIFLPPTNPFTRPETIRRMCALLSHNQKANSIVTVTSPKSHPFRIVRLKPDGFIEIGVVSIDGKTIVDIERSQDFPSVVEGSPACRVTRTSYFWNLIKHNKSPLNLRGKTFDINCCFGFEIPYRESFDINDEEDLLYAEYLCQNRSELTSAR